MKNTMRFFSKSLIFLLLGLVSIMQHGYIVDCQGVAYDKTVLEALISLPLGTTENFLKNEKDSLVQGTEKKDLLGKLNKKIQKLKCVCGKIVLTTIEELKTKPTHSLTSSIKIYRLCVSRMLSTLLTVNVTPASWLWNFHMVLVAAENEKVKDQTVLEKKLSGISTLSKRFVDKCSWKSYLSTSNNLSHSSNVSMYVSQISEMMNLLKNGYKKEHNILNQYVEKFDGTSNIIVDQLKDALIPIGDYSIIKPDVWGSIKKNLESMWAAKADTLIENHSEIMKHHDTIIATVNFSVAYFVWVHVKTVRKNKKNNEYKLSAMRHCRNLIEILRKAVDKLNLQGATFYQNLLEMLRQVNYVIPKFDDLVIKAEENFFNSLNALNDIVIKQTPLQIAGEIVRIGKEESLFTDIPHDVEIPDEALVNINRFRSFVDIVTSKLDSFHWLLMKYYKQSLSDDWDQFV